MFKVNFLKVSIILLTASVSLFSCDSDSESDTLNTTIDINEIPVNVNSALTIDRGLGGKVGVFGNPAPDHYVQSFNISDGEIIYKEGEFAETANATFYLEVTLLSQDSNRIEPGVYEFIDGGVRTGSDNNLSDQSFLWKDLNGNGQIEDDQIDLFGDLDRGTVTVEILEGENKYRLEYDLEFDTEDVVQGSYEGEFELKIERE